MSTLHSSAEIIADTILQAFDKHYRIFLDITRQAKDIFVNCDWAAESEASKTRITLYNQRVQEACEQLKANFNIEDANDPLWQQAKRAYISKLYEHQQPELAETFYNSVFTSFFHRRYYNNSNIFVRPSTSTGYLLSDEQPTYYSFYPLTEGLESTLRQMLTSYDIGMPFVDLESDLQLLMQQFEQHVQLNTSAQDTQLQTISTIFYRNKGAYIVGRIYLGSHYRPFAISLLNNNHQQVYIDAFIIRDKDINNLFSFARAYFMVDTKTPSAIVQFLLQVLPHKTAADLYTSIGLQKQGKTEFYRDFLHHLTHSTDQIIISPGTKGMVMSVFTLPSYPFVFKVIKDKFAPPKNVTRKIVKDKYMLVKMHDRVGRMADTLEFSHVALPLKRFSKELLEELKEKISSSMKIEDDQVIIQHVYIERRLNPLNLYLEDATEEQTEKAIREYGHAIDDLAKANIFPGDMLLKNFGVTQHGRVIFYDYDEIELLTDCNFRHIPPPRYPEDEFAAEPWYSVNPNDVFPEEFADFIFYKRAHRTLFNKRHMHILDADYWNSIQQSIRENNLPDFFPYSQRIRFENLRKV